MGLLEGIVLILVGSAVALLGWIAQTVHKHDGTDRVLATDVRHLGESLKEFKDETKSRLTRLEDGQQEILRRLPPAA